MLSWLKAANPWKVRSKARPNSSAASLAGSLYVAMGVHLLYDVAAGLTLSKYAATRR